MSYRVLVLAAVLLSVTRAESVRAADPRPTHTADLPLPPGAILRLGETRLRVAGPVADLIFSADSTELTTRVGIDNSTSRKSVWEVATGAPLAAAVEPRKPGTQVRWRATSFPDSTRGIILGDDGVPLVRDFATGEVLARLTGHDTRVCAVSVSPDGKRIATGSIDGLIRVWDATSYRPVVEAVGHTAAVRTVTVSPDGRLALTTGADRSARVWNLATGREVRAFPLPPDVQPTFTPDSAALRVPLPDRVIVRDLVTGLEVTSASPGLPPSECFPVLMGLLRRVGVCVAISPDGRTIAVGNPAGMVELYEVATGQVRRVLAGHRGACRDVAFTPDGSRLLSAGTDHVVLVWGVRVRDVPLPEFVKRETSALKLWERMTRGRGEEAYQAIARLAADPTAAVRMAQLRLKPGAETTPVADARIVELLEAVGTPGARAVLRELADDESDTLRVRIARAALMRLGEPRDESGTIRRVNGTAP